MQTTPYYHCPIGCLCKAKGWKEKEFFDSYEDSCEIILYGLSSAKLEKKRKVSTRKRENEKSIFKKVIKPSLNSIFLFIFAANTNLYSIK